MYLSLCIDNTSSAMIYIFRVRRVISCVNTACVIPLLVYTAHIIYNNILYSSRPHSKTDERPASDCYTDVEISVRVLRRTVTRYFTIPAISAAA
jgi:hypothetical protein